MKINIGNNSKIENSVIGNDNKVNNSKETKQSAIFKIVVEIVIGIVVGLIVGFLSYKFGWI